MKVLFGVCAFSLGVGLVCLGGQQSYRSDAGNSDKIRNPHRAFAVRIDVDRPTRVYYEGDELRIRAQSSRDGYLYVINKRPDGQALCIFPNKFYADNRIRAGDPVTLGERSAGFVFRIRPPFGRESLQAIVVDREIAPENLGATSFSSGVFTPVEWPKLKAVVTEANAASWAEHEVEIETKPGTEPAPPQRPRRVALLIGVGKFKFLPARELGAPAADVAAMAGMLERYSTFEELFTLVDEQATREAIERAICQMLSTKSCPGDEVLIYFSGHGGRCADDNGDERDGFDEYLVPFDGRLVGTAPGTPTGASWADADRETMIVDDVFARWLQELDNRRVVVIVDACYSAGLSQLTKSIVPPSEVGVAAGFLDDIGAELTLLKDLGHDVSLLASSDADKPSLVSRDGPLSVMTRFFVECVESKQGPLSLKAIADHIIQTVPHYVREYFPSIPPQVPRLIGEDVAARVIIKP